jgi:hypothetical protein
MDGAMAQVFFPLIRKIIFDPCRFLITLDTVSRKGRPTLRIPCLPPVKTASKHPENLIFNLEAFARKQKERMPKQKTPNAVTQELVSFCDTINLLFRKCP